MAKWFGAIGFAETVETAPGIWEELITDHHYYGDVNRYTRRLQAGNQLNDDINVNNEISIIADPFAVNHIHSMRNVEFQGTRWKVSNVEVVYPRLVLTVGSIYTDGGVGNE